ncbi:SecY-interacting protein Syd [Klebsiella pneumoniae]|nr:SecY-interacting protein Syd [Klebsiella pneumoniae]
MPRSEELTKSCRLALSTPRARPFRQPQPFSLAQNISAVGTRLDIVVQQPLHSYYTTQFAGDKQTGRFCRRNLDAAADLEEEDFPAVQENLIGTVVQKRLKRRRRCLSPPRE